MECHKLTPQDILRCKGKKITVDVETTGLQWWNCQVIGVGLWCPEANIYGYIPTFSEEERQDVRDAFYTLPKDTTFIAHNLKFELHFLNLDPNKHPMRYIDTAIMVHLLDSRYRKGLAECERIFLKTNTKQGFIDRAPHGKKNRI